MRVGRWMIATEESWVQHWWDGWRQGRAVEHDIHELGPGDHTEEGGIQLKFSSVRELISSGVLSRGTNNVIEAGPLIYDIEGLRNVIVRLASIHPDDWSEYMRGIFLNDVRKLAETTARRVRG